MLPKSKDVCVLRKDAVDKDGSVDVVLSATRSSCANNVDARRNRMRCVRENDKRIPILFLTAKSMTEDKLDGFRAGADDYIVKPFSMEELVFRIEVFLKRSRIEFEQEDKVFLIGQYEFDFVNLLLKNRTTEKSLTQKEADVLKLLFQHRERVLKREEILRQVWGDDDYFMGRSMDVFISKLRKYLREDKSIQIVNYHGVGFKLEIGA